MLIQGVQSVFEHFDLMCFQKVLSLKPLIIEILLEE